MVVFAVYMCLIFFFFSSRRRHTRCALVTGVQTCALPISVLSPDGITVLYYDIGNGHYYAYDVPSKRTRKLTEGLPPFWDTYRERNVRNGMDYYTVKLAGWSKDGHYEIGRAHV